MNFLPGWIIDGRGDRSRLILAQRLTRDRIVSFSVGVSRIRVINGWILSVLAVVLRLVRIRDAVTSQGWRWHVYSRTCWLESAPRRSVLDLSNTPSIVDEPVLPVHLASRVFRFDLVRAIRCLVPVTVATVLIVPGRHWMQSISIFW